jgi:hypothetical protein
MKSFPSGSWCMEFIYCMLSHFRHIYNSQQPVNLGVEEELLCAQLSQTMQIKCRSAEPYTHRRVDAALMKAQAHSSSRILLVDCKQAHRIAPANAAHGCESVLARNHTELTFRSAVGAWWIKDDYAPRKWYIMYKKKTPHIIESAEHSAAGSLIGKRLHELWECLFFSLSV